MTWLAPEDVKERARLDSWCAGVGDAVLHNVDGGGQPKAANLDEVTFVSWNVHVGNGDVRAFVGDLTKGALTAGRGVSDYVLLLQEVVRTDGVPPFAGGAAGASRIAARDAANDIVRTSRELGLSLVYVPSMRNGASPRDPAEDRGSAILSTLPLSEPVAVELPGERQRRVVVYAKVGSFTAGVIHLDALGGVQRLRVFWTPWMRDVQARSLEGSFPEGPLVLGADLNTWHGRDELAVRFLNETFATTRVSVDRHGLGLRVLDYLFFRTADGRRARYRQIANKYGSDHRPLVGWIE